MVCIVISFHVNFRLTTYPIVWLSNTTINLKRNCFFRITFHTFYESYAL